MNSDIPAREITPEHVYLNRRTFMKAGILAATTLATGFAYRRLNTPSRRAVNTAAIEVVKADAPASSGFVTDEPRTSFDDITHYNNFYEFSTDKDGVADTAANFRTAGWKIEVGGMCSKPRTFDLDDLLKIAPAEERVYRMRCVEAWSMVIPWAGYSLSKLLQKVEPLSGAKYVAMQTLLDPARMPGQKTDVLNWPYVEGLRLDEAMHPLAILASGIYGKALPPQDGAPIRLVTPWKYGFKGIKSIVKITLVEAQPRTTWADYAPNEYGFYANVNPNVPHPRWSQATEQRIGESDRRKTLMFNGYGEQVADLYAGMDLRRDF
ncbi:MAG TPA: protein-methionine-sulfoxide reductase catalytic subunit MsrP [Phycisphaerae bacterium]|nr:protein-methionine-sulfoxide reductase catalytic subunit MsrP [Phycisphaerae bacterium]